MFKPKSLHTYILSQALYEYSATNLFTYKNIQIFHIGNGCNISVLENFESNDRISNEMYKINIQIRNADINLQYQHSFIASVLEI